VLFHSAAAVLANSHHEPFGLVGLETMAAGGVACIGYTGEDYRYRSQRSIARN
jgi:glycosyltransferase involved in cell wall biosynthesis